MTKSSKAQKEVRVKNTYKFRELARICFVVIASNGQDTYNTCFSHDSQHGSCTCDAHVKGHRECYHISQLRERAAQYFAERTEEQAVNHQTAEAEAEDIVLRARREVAKVEALVARCQEETGIRPAPIGQRGSLSSNRPYSILR